MLSYRSPVLIRHLFIKNKKSYFVRFSHELSETSDYTSTPEYPPIEDLSYKARWIRKEEEWHQKVTRLPTVEQKIMEINMPKFYGYWAAQITDTDLPLAGSEYIRYVTRSHVINRLPETYYDDVRQTAEALLMDVKDLLECCADLHFHSNTMRRERWKVCSRDEQSANFIHTFNNSLCNFLSPVTEHLNKAQIDLDPRIEAFWFVGGFEWDKTQKKSFTKVTENIEYGTRPIQSYVMPSLRVRVQDGLPEVMNQQDTEAFVDEIPISRIDPRSAHYYPKTKHARINTGFWPGAEKEQSQIFFYTRKAVPLMQNAYGPSYQVNSILANLFITAGFSQALAQSMWLGFGPLTELTYPIVQQSVVTDGQRMSLALYQLNTTYLQGERGYNNPRANVLWMSPEEQLYETIEDGKIKGVNYQLLAKLICMYLKSPVPRENATPYLAEYKHVSGFPASEEYRNNFFKQILYMSGNRRRNHVKPHVEWWEYIYKMKFKQRHMDPRLMWFDRGNVPTTYPSGIKPSLRRLDQYLVPRIRKKFWTAEIGRREQYFPRINSERLYKYDRINLKKSVWRDHPDWLVDDPKP